MEFALENNAKGYRNENISPLRDAVKQKTCNGVASLASKDDRRNYDDEEQDDNPNNNTHAHFHILPPHLQNHCISGRHICVYGRAISTCFRTLFAPRRKPCADCAKLSVLSCNESRRAPRSDTLLILSLMMPTVLSISYSD